MANSDKDIKITPNTGESASPKIEVTGADNATKTLTVNDDGSITFDSTLTVSDLTVSGTTTTLNTATMTVEDHNIVLGSGNSTSEVVDATGITLEGGSGDDITFQYNATDNRMELKHGSSFEDLKAGTVTGTFVGNVTGNASGTAATVTGAAQSAITSLGTLTTLTVDNIIINGTTIGHTDDTDLITLADGALTVAGSLQGSQIRIGGSANRIGNPATGELAIFTDSTERVRIDSSGDVGIGTTDPDAKLHVEGSVLIDAYEAGAGAGLFFREGFLNTNQPSITVQDHSGANPDGLAISAYDGISFRLNAVEKARFDSSGNLGIGTSSPGHLLEVVGDGSNGEIVVNRASGAEILLQAQSATGVIGTNTNHDLDIKTNATTRIKIEDGGSVGIGSTSPMNKLQVSLSMADGDDGILIVREDTSTAENDILGGIGFDSTDGNVPSSILEASVALVARAREDHSDSDKGGYLDFYYAPTDQDDDTSSRRGMRMLQGKLAVGGQNGDVGDPINSLVVYHSAENWHNGLLILRDDSSISDGDLLGAIGFDGKDGNNPSNILEASAGIAAYAAEDHSTGDKGGDLTFFTSPIDQDDDTTSIERMRLTSEGLFGIGTTSPGAKLHVDDGVVRAPQLVFGSVASTIIQCENSEFAFGLDNDSPYSLWIQGRTNANAARDISLQPLGGKIGIGTEAPGEKLHVAGGNITLDAGYYYNFRDRSDLGMKEDNYSISIMAPEEVYIQIDSNSNNSDDTFFAVQKDGNAVGGGTELFRVQEDGKVGIGVSAPTDTLAVSGGIKIGEFNSTDGTGYAGTAAPSASNTGTGAADPQIRVAGRTSDQPGIIQLAYFDANNFFGGTDAFTLGKLQFAMNENSNAVTTVAEIQGITSDPQVAGNFDGALKFFTSQGDTSGANLTEKMILNSDGRVGIGTSSPDGPLHIYHTDNTGVPALKIETDAGDAPSDSILRIQESHGSDTYIDFTVNTYGQLEISGGAGTRRPILTADEPDTDASGVISLNKSHYEWDTKIFGDSSTPVIFVDGTNNRMGVGTTSPNQILTLEGTMSLKEQASANADTAAYGQLWVKSDSPNNLYFTNDAGNDVQITNGSSLAGGGGSGAVSAVANGSDNRIATFSSSDALNGEANLTFDGSTLALAGVQTITAADTVNEAFRVDITDSDGTADSTPFVVDGNGRVGIGTASPLSDMALTLNGDGTSYDGLAFQVGGSTKFKMSSDGSAMYFDSQVNTYNFNFRTRNSSGALRPTLGLEGDGFRTAIGYNGTSGSSLNPKNTLQVNVGTENGVQDMDDGILLLNSDLSIADGDMIGGIGFATRDGNIPSVTTEAAAAIVAYAAEDHGTGDKGGDLTFLTSAINDDDDTASNERMRITSEGFVGIGTTSPDAMLHVSSGTDLDCGIIIEADTDNNDEADLPFMWFKQDGDITAHAFQGTSNRFQIINNISASGGIDFLVGTTNNTGTTDPATNATATLSIESDGGVQARKTVIKAVTGNTTLADEDSGKTIYWTAGTLTLPATAESGQQFVVINNTNGSATPNLGTSNAIATNWTAHAAMADETARTYIAVAANTWIYIG